MPGMNSTGAAAECQHLPGWNEIRSQPTEQPWPQPGRGFHFHPSHGVSRGPPEPRIQQPTPLLQLQTAEGNGPQPLTPEESRNPPEKNQHQKLGIEQATAKGPETHAVQDRTIYATVMNCRSMYKPDKRELHDPSKPPGETKNAGTINR